MAATKVPIAPGWPGQMIAATSGRPRFARRRRLVVLVLAVAVLAIAAVANYGPLRTYHESRARLDEVTVTVKKLETEKAALQAELGRLTEAGYLESLAREELTYARPGEDIYIVNTSEGAEIEAVETAPAEPADQRGPLERFLSALGDLF